MSIQNHRLFNQDLSATELARENGVQETESVKVSAVILQFSVSDLMTILSRLRQEKRTGSLTLNFVQGNAAGIAEFKQRTS